MINLLYCRNILLIVVEERLWQKQQLILISMHIDRRAGLGHAETRDRYVDDTFSTDCIVDRYSHVIDIDRVP